MRVLFLTHRLPYAPNRGDRARAYHIVRLLAPRMELDVVSLVHDRQEAAQADRVRELGARVSVFRVPRWKNRVMALPHLLGSRPLTHLLLDAPGIASALQRLARERPPDVILAYCSSMARFAVNPPLAAFPLVIDLLDVDSAKWAAMAAGRAWPMRWVYRREARCLSRFERLAAMQARETVVVNQREADLLKAVAPEASIRIVLNGVDVAELKPPSAPVEVPHVVFCGVMNYAPNVEGVSWFAREVWPLVLAQRPDARFAIVGSDPTEAVRQLAAPDSGISVTGTVPDVRSYLWNAAVSVAPLKTARGVQNKVLEAIAAGLPAVITSQVLDGLPEAVLPACQVADTPGSFAAHVVSLLELSGAARRAITEHVDLRVLSWEIQLAPLNQIVALAAASHHEGERS